MKEQDKAPKEKLSEVERDNEPEKELRVVIIIMMKELRRRMDAQSKKLKKFLTRVRKYKEQPERDEEYDN